MSIAALVIAIYGMVVAWRIMQALEKLVDAERDRAVQAAATSPRWQPSRIIADALRDRAGAAADGTESPEDRTSHIGSS